MVNKVHSIDHGSVNVIVNGDEDWAMKIVTIKTDPGRERLARSMVGSFLKSQPGQIWYSAFIQVCYVWFHNTIVLN